MNDLFIWLLSITSEIFCISSVYLCLVIVMQAMEMLRQLRLEMEGFLTHHNFLLPATDQIKLNLKKWNRRYELLTQLVDHINRCFGVSFLQSFGYFYFALVLEGFQVYLCVVVFREPFYALLYAYSVFKMTSYLFVLVYFPSRIQEEVMLVFSLYKIIKRLILIIF